MPRAMKSKVTPKVKPTVKLTVTDQKYALKARDAFTVKVEYIDIIATSPDKETVLRKRKNSNTERLMNSLKEQGYSIEEDSRISFNGLKEIREYRVKISPHKRSYEAGLKIEIYLPDENHETKMKAVTEITKYANKFRIPMNAFCVMAPDVCQNVYRSE